MTFSEKLHAALREIARGDLSKTKSVMLAMALLTILFYLAPYITLGDQNIWMIWDNLDSVYVYYKILVDSGQLLAPNAAIVAQPLGGVPRSTLPSEFDVVLWLYVIFGPQGAYIVNKVVITLFGYIGMYLLLSRHIISQKEDEPIAIGVALCFAILPFWPFGGLSVAGQPLVMHAILNIRKGNLRWPNWLIISFYPFYSSLVLSGFFFLAMVSCIWMYDVSRRRVSFAFLFAIATIALFYILTHYRLFLDFMLPAEYISHRVEFSTFGYSSLSESIRNTVDHLYRGQPHAESLQSIIILPLLGLTSIYVMLSANFGLRNLFTTIGAVLVVISIFYGFNSFPLVAAVMNPIKTIIPMQFDRFYFLAPMLWMIMFAIALKALTSSSPPLRLVLIAAVTLQAFYSFTKHEFIANRRSPTISQFFAKRQLADVRHFIGMPVNSYRIASLGIHPSVALFNGFYTLDGYWSNYPLKYKHRFRQIIAGELAKERALMRYYDNWGSRVYMFNGVTGRDMVIQAGNEIIIENPAFDWDAFYELGGRFLLSAVQIRSGTSSQLEFVNKFVDAQSAWDVYLYKVKPSL